MARTSTTKLTFRPLLGLAIRPRTKPTIARGITNQFSQPSKGKKPTSAPKSAIRPMMIENTFIGLTVACLDVNVIHLKLG